MINMDHKQVRIKEALKLDKNKANLIHRFWGALVNHNINDNKPISWLLSRVWIDETLNDNMKCYLIFCLGRLYETNAKGGE